MSDIDEVKRALSEHILMPQRCGCGADWECRNVMAAIIAYGDRRVADARAVRAPFRIDCDDCGQGVVIPEHGDVGCGCAGTRWSLNAARLAVK